MLGWRSDCSWYFNIIIHVEIDLGVIFRRFCRYIVVKVKVNLAIVFDNHGRLAGNGIGYSWL